jgi:hypothetical protein
MPAESLNWELLLHYFSHALNYYDKVGFFKVLLKHCYKYLLLLGFWSFFIILVFWIITTFWKLDLFLPWGEKGSIRPSYIQLLCIRPQYRITHMFLETTGLFSEMLHFVWDMKMMDEIQKSSNTCWFPLFHWKFVWLHWKLMLTMLTI